MRAIGLCAVAIFLLACADEPEAEGEEGLPAAGTLSLQPITFEDLEKNDLFGAGCYILAGEGEDMVFLGDDLRGAVKLDGRIVLLSPDDASAELPYLSRERYEGAELNILLGLPEGDGEPVGEEAVRWPGSIEITDKSGKTIYAAEGILECGA